MMVGLDDGLVTVRIGPPGQLTDWSPGISVPSSLCTRYTTLGEVESVQAESALKALTGDLHAAGPRNRNETQNPAPPRFPGNIGRRAELQLVQGVAQVQPSTDTTLSRPSVWASR